jgi:hypothetical protein
MVVPFLLAVVLATILIPPLHWLTAHRVPLPLAMPLLVARPGAHLGAAGRDRQRRLR